MAPKQTTVDDTVAQVTHRGWHHMLLACPMKNQAIHEERIGHSDALLISVQRKKPRFLIPPISWIIKINMTRRFQLDRVGMFVWDQCNGERDIEAIILCFSERFSLTFHEARVSVTSYVKDLVQRGALVLVIDNQETTI